MIYLAIILTLMFLFIKLAELGVVADWSYWAVFSPVIIGTALLITPWIGMGFWLFISILRDNVRSFVKSILDIIHK